MNTIIIYYSKSGKTQALAQKIKADLNCDILKLEPQKEYGGYISAVLRAGKEIVTKTSSKYKTQIPDLSPYDRIFLGYPIWYSAAPSFVIDFISKCETDGKEIVAFATAGANGIASSLDGIKKVCPKAKLATPFCSTMMNKGDYDSWIKEFKE